MNNVNSKIPVIGISTNTTDRISTLGFTKGQQEAYNNLLEFINSDYNPNDFKRALVGYAGTGKTYLSSCVANELIKKGYSVLYQTAPVLLDDIMRYKYDTNSSHELYENLFNVNLLIIDDLGTENASGAKFTEIFTIINARMLKPDTKTIISTNFTLKELSKIYDTRIMSRLIGGFDILGLFGNDLRLKK